MVVIVSCYRSADRVALITLGQVLAIENPSRVVPGLSYDFTPASGMQSN